MSEPTSIIVAFHALNYQGQQILGEQWPPCLALARRKLQENGFADKDSSDELFFYTYNHPLAALTSITNSLAFCKQECNWPGSAPLPLQIVLHLGGPNQPHPGANLTSGFWEMLKPEKIYITRNLKNKWEALLAGQQLPPCTLEAEGTGLYLLNFANLAALKSKVLFPHRDLPNQGGGKPCFYCGMANHQAKNCPCKFLNLAESGLALIGYLPFPRMAASYENAFAHQEQLLNTIQAGIKEADIRRDPALQVYLAYFDLMKIYQPRFLWRLAFGSASKWETARDSQGETVDSKNLHLGLDSLRVFQYEKAEEYLLRESKEKGGKGFYALVGLAFLALERGRRADFGNFLEKANNVAMLEKERVYIGLLQARYLDLNGDTWKAKETIGKILALAPGCQDAQYRKIQIEVQSGFSEEGFNALRTLAIDQREFFITVLMDPQLQPIQSKIEDMLAAHYQARLNTAQTNLAQAKEIVADLALWLGEEDSEAQKTIKIFSHIEKQFQRQGYYDLLDVASKANLITSTGSQIRTKKLDKLYSDASRLAVRWNGYSHFWQNYPYQRLFKEFHQLLAPIKKRIGQINGLAKEGSGKSYRDALLLLAEVHKNLDHLKVLHMKMNSLKLFLDGARLFGKRLLLTELLFLGVGATLLAVANANLPSGAPTGIAKLIDYPNFYRHGFLFSALFLAPIVALAITIWQMNRD